MSGREVNSKAVAEMREIAAEHGGNLRPEPVVEFARNPRTALHARFEWDDTEAGRRYRLQQAADLIRRVYVQLVDDGKGSAPVRAWVSLSPDRGEGIYRPITRVMSDAEMRAQHVADVVVELEQLRTKHKHLTELAAVWAAIKSARKHAKNRGGKRRKGAA